MTVQYPANISFAYDNVVFDATNITPGSQVATMPASNLRFQERGAFWRTTGVTAETLLLALSEAKSFNFMGLLDHNLTTGATVRVQANTSNSFSGTTPYDETFTIGTDLAAAAGYAAPVGKVAPPEVFFLNNPTGRGAIGDAALFATDDAYSIADHADFKPTTNFSVGCFVKSTNMSSHYLLQSYAEDSTAAGWFLGTIGGLGTPFFYTAKNTGKTLATDYQRIKGNTNICDGNWHLLVATWNGTYLNIYVDGVQDATSVAWVYAPAYKTTNYVRIACHNTNSVNTDFFNGSLTHLFIYNGTALSTVEINNIYNNGLTITTNLKAWYKFAAAAMTYDNAPGNSHALTAISSPANVPGGGPIVNVSKFPYVLLTFADPANTAGYLQLGVLWLGEYLESEQPYQYGIMDTLVDPSTISQSMGGQDWPDEEEMYMQLSFTIGNLSDTAKYYQFRQFFFAVRKTRFFILMLQPGTAMGRALMSAYGRFTENTKFANAFYDQNTLSGLEFKEVR